MVLIHNIETGERGGEICVMNWNCRRYIRRNRLNSFVQECSLIDELYFGHLRGKKGGQNVAAFI